MPTDPTNPNGAARTKTHTQALARDLITEYDKRHGPHADLWILGEVLVGIIRAAWWALRIVARFPIVSFAFAVLGYTYWEFGQVGPALLCALLLAGLLSWRVIDGDSFSEFVTWRVWSSWRAWRRYGRHWDSAMTMAGLGDRYLSDPYVPLLLRARCRPNVDRLTVQLLQGQHPDDFAAQADTLAHTFGALSCRSRIAGPGRHHPGVHPHRPTRRARPGPRRQRRTRPRGYAVRAPRGRRRHDGQAPRLTHAHRRGDRCGQGLGVVVADSLGRPAGP